MRGWAPSSSMDTNFRPLGRKVLSFLQVDDLSSIRVYIAKDLRPLEARERAARSVDEVLRRFPNGVPTLDPEEDMQVPARRASRWICSPESSLVPATFDARRGSSTSLVSRNVAV